jgi:hypothetical protein
MFIMTQHAMDNDQQEVVQFQQARKRNLLRRLRSNAKRGVLFIAQLDVQFADLYTADLEVALTYLKWTELIYPMLGPLKRNRQVMEAAIRETGDNVHHFDGSLIDLALWKKCLAHHHEFFEEPPAGLPAALLTQQTLRECIPENGYLVDYLEDVDKAIGLAAVQAEPEALEFLPPELYENDVDFARAITYGGGYHCHLLQEFSFEIRANFGVMLAAVKANGSSLRYAAHELRCNPELCFTAVREDPEALFSCVFMIEGRPFPWAEPLVCVAIGKQWTQPDDTRNVFNRLGAAQERAVKAYAEGVARSARGFDLLSLHFSHDHRTPANTAKRTASRTRLNADCLLHVRGFLPKGSLYREAERALAAILQLEADEPRHQAQLQAQAQRAFQQSPQGRRLNRVAKALA